MCQAILSYQIDSSKPVGGVDYTNILSRTDRRADSSKPVAGVDHTKILGTTDRRTDRRQTGVKQNALTIVMRA